MKKYNVLAVGVAITCPVAVSTLVGCDSAEPGGQGVQTQSELLTVADANGGNTVTAAANLSLDDWKRTTPSALPSKGGCFEISYPSAAWTEIPCAPVSKTPERPPLPATTTSLAQTASASSTGIVPLVYGGNDWAATVSDTTITKVEGSFPVTYGLSAGSEYTDMGNNNHALDSYVLQVNAGGFVPPGCRGHGSSCTGWQQFEYSSRFYSGVMMEFWMFNYVGDCTQQPGWYQWDASTCYTLTQVTSVPTSGTEIQNLGNLKLLGVANQSGYDKAILQVGSKQYAASANSSTLSLSKYWKQVEFNVLGDIACREAFFGPATILDVQTRVWTAKNTTTLNCVTNPMPIVTCESNNLAMWKSCMVTTGNPGTVWFYERD
jgi:hypothetical protein